MADPLLRRGLIDWLARHPVAANLLMVVLLVGGLLSTRDVRQEVFPEVTRDVVLVTVAYPGASPVEVEEGIVLAVEEAIRRVDGVEEIRAKAKEGLAEVTADLLRGTDPKQALSDVKSEVDRITTFPESAERPVITVPTNRREVVTVILHGQQSRATLKARAEDVRRALLANPEISVVEVAGVPPPEISIEVSQEALRRFGLKHEDVARAVSAASVDVPAGGVKTDTGEVLLRTTEKRERGREFRDIAIKRLPDGSTVTVGDVATVEDTYRETGESVSFDGEPAILVKVFRVGDQTPLEVAEVVRRYVESQRGKTPGLSYTLWNDRSEVYASRLDLLLRNAGLGLALVLLTLGLFLQPRLAFWVTLGIPISFLGALIFLPLMNVSVNMISLFAFLLALGIVVDDAIVVGESVFAERKVRQSGTDAAVAGTRRVAVPVVFAVLTTIVAFIPLLFLPDTTGKFFANIPLIVIPILLLSLVEALAVLPAHLAHDPTESRGWLRHVDRVQRRFSEGVEGAIERFYRPVVSWIVRYRWVTAAVGAATLMLVYGAVAGGLVRYRFFPKIEGDQVSVTVEMPFGTGAEQTRRIADRVAAAARQQVKESGITDSRGVITLVAMTSDPNYRGLMGTHLATVEVDLGTPEGRPISAREFTRRWREAVGDVAGPKRIGFTFAVGPGNEASYAIELRHPDRPTLRRAAAEMAERLRGLAGVYDVDDGFREGKQQLDFRLSPEARALGITEQDLASQLRSAFYGAEAQRLQRGRDELRVYVRRPEAERQSLYYLDELLVRTPTGGEIPLRRAAEITPGESYTVIDRENASRAVDITADVDPEVTTATEIQSHVEERVLPELLASYPGMTWEKSGQQLREARTAEALSTTLALAFLVMYALMALVFRSYVQPLIILVAIPFGIVGAVLGHVAMGYDLSVVSILGMVALSGVVVNDSLVLIAATNDNLREGASPEKAVIDAGVRRFRPILLTSLTTFFGLVPMILETSVQARFLVPMALSLGFGVLFVTFIALGLVPALFMVVADLSGGRSVRVAKEAQPSDPLAAASGAE